MTLKDMPSTRNAERTIMNCAVLLNFICSMLLCLIHFFINKIKSCHSSIAHRKKHGQQQRDYRLCGGNDCHTDRIRMLLEKHQRYMHMLSQNARISKLDKSSHVYTTVQKVEGSSLIQSKYPVNAVKHICTIQISRGFSSFVYLSTAMV